VGLERCPLSLVWTTDELLDGNVAAPVLKPEINDRGNPLRWPSDILYLQKLALTSPSGGRSVGIVHSRTKAAEFSFQLVGGGSPFLNANAVVSPQIEYSCQICRSRRFKIPYSPIINCYCWIKTWPQPLQYQENYNSYSWNIQLNL
jgi:hypothetical protein